MSGYFKQMRHSGPARRLLRERLEREEIGEAEYQKMLSYHDDRAFKIFGVVFIAAFGAIILGVVLLDY
jgi:hypothetical protein